MGSWLPRLQTATEHVDPQAAQAPRTDAIEGQMYTAEEVTVERKRAPRYSEPRALYVLLESNHSTCVNSKSQGNLKALLLMTRKSTLTASFF